MIFGSWVIGAELRLILVYRGTAEVENEIGVAPGLEQLADLLDHEFKEFHRFTPSLNNSTAKPNDVTT